MGTRPLRTRKHWAGVDKWRKREAYIALGRSLLGYDAGYRQWDCFLWKDFLIRSQLYRTFDVRHLPLSDGRDEVNFQGKYKFDWKKHHYSPAKQKGKASSYVKPEPRQESAVQTQSQERMIFDVELGKLVPLDS